MSKTKLKKIWNIEMFAWHRPRNWKDNFRAIWRNHKSRRQRAKYGVSSMDCWNFDSYFFDILYNGMVLFKEGNIGYPGQLTPEEWDNILDRIRDLADICGVDLSNRVDDTTTNYEEVYQQHLKEKRELFDLLDKWIDGIWW